MKNKTLFKKVYQEKINKDRNYEEIIARLNNPKTKKRRYIGLAYASIILVLLCSLFTVNKYNLFQNHFHNSKNDMININRIDDEIDNVNKDDFGVDGIDNNIPKLSFDNLDLPKDFENKYITKEIYDDNQKINNYVSIFNSIDNNRKIIINYVKENKLLNIYSLDNPKQSRINGIQLIIYFYKEKYISEFTYKDVNYIVETEKLTEDELIILLKSIIN